MPLFQSAILNKYLKQQGGAHMAQTCAAFAQHLYHTSEQPNICEAKDLFTPTN